MQVRPLLLMSLASVSVVCLLAPASVSSQPLASFHVVGGTWIGPGGGLLGPAFAVDRDSTRLQVRIFGPNGFVRTMATGTAGFPGFGGIRPLRAIEWCRPGMASCPPTATAGGTYTATMPEAPDQSFSIDESSRLRGVEILPGGETRTNRVTWSWKAPAAARSFFAYIHVSRNTSIAPTVVQRVLPASARSVTFEDLELSANESYALGLFAFSIDIMDWGSLTSPFNVASDSRLFEPAPQPPRCADYLVIDSRDSGAEPRPSMPGLRFFAEATERFRTQTVRQLANPYPAAGGIPTPSGGAVNVRSSYARSLADGKSRLRRLVASRLRACPKAKVFLTGHGQGAHLTGDVYHALAGARPSWFGRIVGVALFGDPRFNSADRRAARGTPRFRVGRNGFLGPRKPFPASTRGRVRSFCHRHDYVCQATPLYDRFGLAPHRTYHLNGEPREALLDFARLQRLSASP
jgi:Cutinase